MNTIQLRELDLNLLLVAEVIYRHRNLKPNSPYLRGFSDDFSIPVSRWTETLKADVQAIAEYLVSLK